MIRALSGWLPDAGLRRFVGLVALIAFVFVVALSAAHAGEKCDPGHDDCGVCAAAATIGTSECFAAPTLLALLDACNPAPIRDAGVPASSEPRRAHAPRGPPAAL